MSDTMKPTGRAKGAIALAESMTVEERRERSTNAAVARWGLKASHKGNFKDLFGVDAECYVLNDARKTAVMTQRSMAEALGLSKPGGNDFQRLVERPGIAKHLGGELLEKVRQPIDFTWIYPGGKQSVVTIKGYSADLIIDVCNAILAADAAGDLRKNQANLARQARIITTATAKSGITQIVYALAGYNPTADEVLKAFKLYVQEEAKKYEKEFPSEIYMAWHRLYQIPVHERGKPWQFKKLTTEHVYFPLAKSGGKILELVRALKAADGDRKKKLFQFLNEIGTRALRMHLGRVLEMAESSADREEYEKKIVDRFGGQQSLELVVIHDEAEG